MVIYVVCCTLISDIYGIPFFKILCSPKKVLQDLKLQGFLLQFYVEENRYGQTESEKMEFFEDISYSEYTREHYEVSTFGTVINKKTKRMLTPFIRSGYPTVLIPIGDGNVKHFPLHRLVAETFLPNPLNLPQVNHKDQNKLNPRVDNLEWCTCQYNINYGDAIYRRVVSMIGHTPEVVVFGNR